MEYMQLGNQSNKQEILNQINCLQKTLEYYGK